MRFSEVQEALNEGSMIFRTGWNGKGLFVYKQVPSKCSVEVIERMTSLPESARAHFLKKGEPIRFGIQMCIVGPDNLINSWVPSCSDLFADDWCIHNAHESKETPSNIDGIIHESGVTKE